MIDSAERVVPETLDALSEAMRGCHARGEALTFVGGGTDLGLGYPPERVDRVISTQQLARVVDYAPDDMTVTVEAGVTLAALQAAVAQRGQRLALDPPRPERTTIGGLLATNGYGPRRARYGTLRDLVLGASLVRADGERVRGGGKVVKNVAGFDVPKLLVGSLGSLGCIASATFRLHPLPEMERTVVMRCASAASVRALCVALTEAQLEPSAVVAFGVDGEFDVAILFEGFASGVDQQATACATRARALGIAPSDGAGDATWRARHDAARTRGDVRVKATFRTAAFAEVDRGALAPLQRTLRDAALVVYPTAGVAFCCGDAADAEAVLAALAAARTCAELAGGTLVAIDAPGDVRQRFDVYGTTPGALPLMREIKARFDPDRRCNAGRFVGHL